MALMKQMKVHRAHESNENQIQQLIARKPIKYVATVNHKYTLRSLMIFFSTNAISCLCMCVNYIATNNCNAGNLYKACIL